MKSVKTLKDRNLKTDDAGVTTKTRDMRAADNFGKSYFKIWLAKLIVTTLFVGYTFSVAYYTNNYSCRFTVCAYLISVAFFFRFIEFCIMICICLWVFRVSKD